MLQIMHFDLAFCSHTSQPHFPAGVLDNSVVEAAVSPLPPPSRKRTIIKREVKFYTVVDRQLIYFQPLNLPNDKRAGQRVTYHINFAGTNYRLNSAWRPLSFKNKAKVTFYNVVDRV